MRLRATACLTEELLKCLMYWCPRAARGTRLDVKQACSSFQLPQTLTLYIYHAHSKTVRPCKHSKRSRPRLSRAQRDQCKGLAQHVFDASDVQKPLAEAQLLAQTSSDPRLAAYATSVLRSLHGGAKLHIVRKVAAAETEQEKQFAEHFRKLIMDCSGEGDEEEARRQRISRRRGHISRRLGRLIAPPAPNCPKRAAAGSPASA